MIKTYQVLDKNREVQEYFTTKNAAQNFMIKNFNTSQTLLMMKGPTFGEGFHKYEMERTPESKFRYTKRY